MGLDMYAYVAAKAGQQAEFYEGSEWDPDHKEHRNPNVNKPRELAYWRKHPNLHGWMAQLWLRREGNELRETDNFNGVELELTYEDLDDLEYAVHNNQLPATSGFFFCGIMLLPVEYASSSSTKLNSLLDHRIISSEKRDICTIIILITKHTSIAKSLSATPSKLLCVTPFIPS